MVSGRKPSSSAMMSAWAAARSAMVLTDSSVTLPKCSMLFVTNVSAYSTYSSFVCGGGGGVTLRAGSSADTGGLG